MNIQAHEQLKSHIWEIANRLRGPYRPPQYRLVMFADCGSTPTRLRSCAHQGRCTYGILKAHCAKDAGKRDGKGFSLNARTIFERFKFSDQIEKLDASNRLFTIVKAMVDVDLICQNFIIRRLRRLRAASLQASCWQKVW